MKNQLFTTKTTAIVYGLHAAAIQSSLDFDYISKRSPSISAIITPNREGWHKAFYGKKEILLPTYKTTKDAVKKHKKSDVFVNFASFRSAYKTTKEALNEKTIKTIIIIAEGIPENRTRELIAIAKQKKKIIIGPSTVGGLKAGVFRIGFTGGNIENIIESKLYRSGSVGVVTKSGGMANEMFNIISRNTNGINEGIAIGGDKYPGSTLLDHLLRFEKDPGIKMMIALGELGTNYESEVAEALKKGLIKKPLIAWVSGSCAKLFGTEVQFGHAGAIARNKDETADRKNKMLKENGAIVPNSFSDLEKKIRNTYNKLKASGKIKETIEEPIPIIPIELKTAIKTETIRKPSTIISSISNDDGEELTYNKIEISEIIQKNYSIGEVISLLWFKKKLPEHATKFIELMLIITADHGPSVSGAHNSIVASRAGKDVVSSLASGILTIGPRFGGAIDDAAKNWKMCVEEKKSAKQFVDEMNQNGKYIPGIGHRVKSVNNPDKRVSLLKNYAKRNFRKKSHLKFALEVEKETTKKRGNLILNVDGCIAAMFLDLMDNCPQFSREEKNEIIKNGTLNSFFVLGRSIGLIGHILDQKRLKQPLYRHPTEDTLYLE